MALTDDPIERIHQALRQVYDPELGLEIDKLLNVPR